MHGLTSDATSIWQAGIEAVLGKNLVQQVFSLDAGILTLDAQFEFPLAEIDRILILGAGKAAAGMAEGFLQFWSQYGDARIPVHGWLNVPAGTFSTELKNNLKHPTNLPGKFSIELHPAREAGSNEPTAAGVYGTKRMLELAQNADARTLVLCFISGGASALTPAPIAGLSLADKLELTRFFAQSGANIETINEVRRCLSQVKGGGLARAASRAHQIVSLIISDVLGDPIEFIGSGPTVVIPTPDPIKALELVDQWDKNKSLPRSVRELLRQQIESRPLTEFEEFTRPVINHILANNATAVDAAGTQAVAIGYAYWMESNQHQGIDVSTFAATLMRGIEIAVEITGADSVHSQVCSSTTPNCLILGGEPTLTLPPPAIRGKGGRNQQLALELLKRLLSHPNPRLNQCQGIAIVCGGTDGEDGPTLAAGAIVNESVMARTRELNLDPTDYLSRCDAYHFFELTGGLLVTGPTNTNVCDLTVVLVGPNNEGLARQKSQPMA